MNTRRLGSLALFASLLGAALFFSGVLDIRLSWNGHEARAIDFFGSDEEESAPFWAEGSNQPPLKPQGVPESFADLAAQVSPGVVNIQTSRKVTGNQMPRGLEEFFFGGPFGQSPRERTVPSLGSGFVISEDGYIVTNNHVIENVDSIQVLFRDEREFEAEVIGRDPKTDLALLRIETDDKLFALPLGDSESVRPGEWVVAIGNPYGLEHTVTAGIVSAKHRIIGQGSYDDFIQTDAAINPGNSGGPLINLRGEVIGINTAINPRANTIGFAVPINMAKGVLPQLRADGHVTRGWLGVVIQRITPEIASHLELEQERGALVSRVMPDGPADDAGIQRYDVIVEFDDKPIDEMNDLPRAVAATRVGRKVDVTVLRDGKRKELRAKIAKMEEPQETQLASADQDDGTSAYGLRVQNLTPDLAGQLGIEGDEGVVVTGVSPGSSAAEAGLRREDVILEVDKTEVNDVGALEEQLADATDGALLLIRRGDATVFVPLKPPAS
ncbi:MAG: DegQ family serine endoprotease [Myxococcota bacterium]|nr:DegQ family serine endoprotease [Myxococcota bacterium]